jgi:hypothetical protein
MVFKITVKCHNVNCAFGEKKRSAKHIIGRQKWYEVTVVRFTAGKCWL